MTKTDLHQLVDALPDEAVEAAGILLKRVLRGEVDPEQAWVWTTEWQDQLRSSLADVAEGRSRRFDSSGEFLASL
jgi:hypothetical protein